MVRAAVRSRIRLVARTVLMGVLPSLALVLESTSTSLIQGLFGVELGAVAVEALAVPAVLDPRMAAVAGVAKAVASQVWEARIPISALLSMAGMEPLEGVVPMPPLASGAQAITAVARRMRGRAATAGIGLPLGLAVSQCRGHACRVLEVLPAKQSAWWAAQ